jgi:hypothetical protein
MIVKTNLKQLYTLDEHQWLLKTIELLKKQKFEELDLENLIEELEALGKRDKNAVESLLEQIIRHLLLYQYWTEKHQTNAHHWHAEISGFRNQLKRKLTKNLYDHLSTNQESLYQDALTFVIPKTNYKVQFPQQCPYSLEQLLDINYLP